MEPCKPEMEISMENTKHERLLEIFFRSLRGEDLFIRKLAEEYKVSTKSISRDINDLKAFLADHRELVGNTELTYSHQSKCYRLYMDEFLSNKELFAMVEVLIGARAFSQTELLKLIDKLKRFTTAEDRPKLNGLIRKELYHYSEVKHDCESVMDMIWKLVNCITEKREVTIEYCRIDRVWRTHRIRPASLMFADHYFYLIAFKVDDEPDKPFYFRVDRIKYITKHQKNFILQDIGDFDEGLLRERSLFMWPGKLRKIRFEYSGSSVQAVLDKLSTAKIIDRSSGKYILEAEVYGDGIKMWLLSQGSKIKVTEPAEFVQELKNEIITMNNMYNEMK